MAILPPDPVFCLKGDMDHVRCLCFPKQNDILLAATESGFVHTWDLNTNRLRCKQKLGESIQTMHSYDDKLITQEKMGLIKLWNVSNESNYELITSCEYYGGYCKSLLLEDCLIVPQEGALEALDVKTMSSMRKFVPLKDKLGNVMCLQRVELNGNIFLLAGFETGDVILWDFVTAEPCSHVKLRECITSLTFDPITSRGICGNASNVLEIFTIDKNFKITLKCELSITNEGCNVVKLRPDRKIFVCGGWDGRLRLFSWKSLRPLVVLAEHRGAVTDVQFSGGPIRLWGSNIMAASGGDGVVSLWNLYN